MMEILDIFDAVLFLEGIFIMLYKSDLFWKVICKCISNLPVINQFYLYSLRYIQVRNASSL